jgi:long-chain-fatty-acid--[acyl-carrier-protein] ligase
MVDVLIRGFVRFLLFLRYRITVKGLFELAPKDPRGILILPNHPALIEPIILLSNIARRFQTGVLADREQIDRPVIRTLAKRIRVKALADPGKERDAKAQIQRLVDEVISELNQGHVFVLYPAGRIYRQKFEDLGGNSAVETILRACPDIRVVLARTEGLWGSAFSRANGKAPSVVEALKRGVRGMLASGIFFMPRRKVTLTFHEPTDFPRDAERNALNRYLERFFNENATGNTYVPYSIFESGGTRLLPEPSVGRDRTRALEVPAATREIVIAHLRKITGVSTISPEMRLAMELGLDSLARVELQAFVESEFGFPQSDGDAFDTVQDVLLAACGEGSHKVREDLKPVQKAWFDDITKERLSVAEGETITEAFLNAAANRLNRVVIADQSSGARTYREIITAIFVLRSEIRRMKGDYVGLMLPASVAAVLAYLAILFAGKTPVMLNFTTGPRGVSHAVDALRVEQIISARKLITKLKNEGFGEATALLGKMLFLDELVPTIPFRRKLKAAIYARFFWRSLGRVRCPETIAVLFTSGSENVPKAVPLTSRNILTNDRDVLDKITINQDDSLLAMLPPFHSFGLTVDLVLPLITGLRTVYYNNPTESAKLAAHIEQYQVTILVGTPTFLGGIVHAAREGQLDTLRLAVTGAEQCPPRVYDALESRCPNTVVIEGYGITECSPVVSVNIPGRQVRGTIGEAVGSLEIAIVNPEGFEPIATGERGLLLVRGLSVFSGYLHYEGPSPFVDYDGKSWYKTGDLVRVDDRGILTFAGRMKRFIKLGGEMISLPAIEAVLESAFPTKEGTEGPVLAVECASGEHPELVLFTTVDIEREVVNRAIREGGLSPLHSIRRIVRLESIPVLGTGKTDYRTLKAMLGAA